MNAIDKKFIKFHQDNPHIYTEIKKYCTDVWQAGHQHFGMKAIVERIRWDHTVGSVNKDFKISNDYTSRYARLIEKDYPRAEGFFRTKKLSVDSLFAVDYKHSTQKHLWP